MKNFMEWLSDISESVTFRVGVERPVQDITSLAYMLNIEIQKRFPNESQQAKNKYEIIAADGLEVEHIEGIINFYSEGIPEQSILKMLSAIKYYIGEMGGQITTEPRKDVSRMFGGTVYRIPVKMRTVSQDQAPELNISNVNAQELLSMLNIYTPDLMGEINVRELAMKLATLTDFSIQMGAQAPEQGVGRKGARWFDAGRSIQQIERYIQTLNNMVQWAIQHHYDTINFS